VRNLRDPRCSNTSARAPSRPASFPFPRRRPAHRDRIREIVPVEEGLSRYRYPLNTERFSAQPLEEVSVHVEVETQEPLRAVYSPSHDVAVDRPDDFHFAPATKRATSPDTDFELFWSVSPGLHRRSVVVTSTSTRRAFPLLAAPGIDDRRRSSPRTSSSCWIPRAAWRARRSCRRGGAPLRPRAPQPGRPLQYRRVQHRRSRVRSRLVAPAEAERRPGVEQLASDRGTDINLALLTASAWSSPSGRR
jgi:hypothetical protein